MTPLIHLLNSNFLSPRSTGGARPNLINFLCGVIIESETVAISAISYKSY